MYRSLGVSNLRSLLWCTNNGRVATPPTSHLMSMRSLTLRAFSSSNLCSLHNNTTSSTLVCNNTIQTKARGFASSSNSSSSSRTSSSSSSSAPPPSNTLRNTSIVIFLSAGVLISVLVKCANEDPALWGLISVKMCAKKYKQRAQQLLEQNRLDEAIDVLRKASKLIESKLKVGEASPEAITLRIALTQAIIAKAYTSAAANSMTPNKLAPTDEDIDNTRAAWESLALKPFVGEAVKEEMLRIEAAAKAADALGDLYAAKGSYNEAVRAWKWCIESLASPPAYFNKNISSIFDRDPQKNPLLARCMNSYETFRKEIAKTSTTSTPTSTAIATATTPPNSNKR
eukprot:TRINITY_DN2889_c0_g1_i1.p1 TRINITY_DN2889_c0_g1~~TRINITY_DN2889_c0_g1_i1.p1  ORF type:complete len:342 (+),score=97.65 TRINITY_DN2889_c0_g1_i1:46-1071(+)